MENHLFLDSVALNPSGNTQKTLTSAVQFHFTAHSPKKYIEQLGLLSFTVQTTDALGTC